MFKLYAGPLFHAIEKEVYKDPSFIKHVAVSSRPAFIRDLFEGEVGPFVVSDYTSFERWFSVEFMDACEFQLYEHMLQSFPFDVGELRRVMLGENRISYRDFVIRVMGRRMSGEMCTSLGNGWTNLMLARFTAHKCGCTLKGVVEGDDALLKYSGPVTTRYIEELGFVIKYAEVDSIEKASFCGILQSRDGITLLDPFKKLIGFGWSHSRLIRGRSTTLLGLLRAKAMSLAYEAPRCPIIFALAKRCLTFTAGVLPRFEPNYWNSRLIDEINNSVESVTRDLIRGPSHIAREDFAEMFGVSIEVQRGVESEIEAWQGGELAGPWVSVMMAGTHHTSADYYQRYCKSTTEY